MSNPAVANNHYTVFVAELFDLINAQRKLLRKSPIEDRAMSSRCTLRFAVVSGREVDFNVEKITILSHEVPLLEKMINDQFGIYFEGEVQKLCEKSMVKQIVKPPKPEPILQIAPEPEYENESSGIIAAIKRFFGR